MNFDKIIILVKETITAYGYISIEDDETIVIDSNDFDNIAEDIASALCGKENEHGQPKADVEHVRHGLWKKVSEKSPRYVCTECHHLFNNRSYKRCPECGAKMDWEVNQ